MKKTFAYVLVPLIIISTGVYIILSNQEASERLIKRDNPVNNDVPAINPDIETDNIESSRYVIYNPELFLSKSDKKRVYFFHASWCPTCKQASAEFEASKSKIPEDVVLFRTDYDSNDDLKRKYGITYQHTFVYVDENGEEIKKWNGGSVDELITNTQ